MALAKKEALLTLVVDSLRSSGWVVERLTPQGTHPADFLFWNQHGLRLFRRVYIWNVSHGGGRARSPNEYRIQVTGISGFDAPHEGDVIILGWFEELGVFASFDYMFHRGALGNSPSIQIGRDALLAAVENGLSPYPRGNGELAVAVRWDMLSTYILRMRELHALGSEDSAFRALLAITDNPYFGTGSIKEVSLVRRRVLVTTARILRDLKFRDRVMIAYGNSCAFCGLQLDMLDAAHILPANHERSTDLVTNGVALCALHHRAYDRCLVTFNDNYEIVVHKGRLENFRAKALDGGKEDFCGALNQRLTLPRNREQWPDPEMIALANELRGWTEI